MRSRTHILTSLMLTTLLVLTGAGQLDAVVVCVGLEGHVDLESSFGECCSSSAGPGLAGDTLQTAHGTDCGPCTDLLVTAPQLRAKQIHLAGPALTHTTATSRELPDSRIEGGERTQRDQLWRSLMPLSTVVLLT